MSLFGKKGKKEAAACCCGDSCGAEMAFMVSRLDISGIFFARYPNRLPYSHSHS